ncbi:MAG: phosphatase PAP2 family protein, partial [Flavobacterium sp.]|nr:phosphatase PAP2 family protein [Flavobacterium sp.]
MLEKILSLDTRLFIYLNSLGSETYDGFWLFITKQANWTPFFLLLLYLIYKKLGAKQTLFLLLFVAALVTITDQTTNLFKHTFQRLRPCNNLEIKSFIRIVQSRDSFSFFSGHAANTMAVATF